MLDPHILLQFSSKCTGMTNALIHYIIDCECTTSCNIKVVTTFTVQSNDNLSDGFSTFQHGVLHSHERSESDQEILEVMLILCNIIIHTTCTAVMQSGHECPPFVGDMGIASIQQNWFRSLAGGLGCCGVVQEVAHHLPEQGALGVALLEVKSSWACQVTIQF